MAARKRDFRHFGKVRHPARRAVRRIALFICAVFLFTTVMTAFFIDSFSIGSASMEPTFSQGDRIFTTPLAFGPRLPFTSIRFVPLREPERGELVVCSPPFYSETTLQRLALPFVDFFTLRNTRNRGDGAVEWESTAFVKRVIAVPGDTVLIENFIAFVKPEGEESFINERVLNNRQYAITLTPLPKNWAPSYPFSGTMEPVTLGENEYFVLGDNRSQSHDSRHFGPISAERMLQKVIFRYFPLRKAGGA